MSLPTEPFTAPSTRPQAVVLQRAATGELPAWDPDAQESRRRPALVAAGAVGVLAVGATVAGVALTSGGPVPVSPSSLAPAAGAAATLTPPVVGNPIVPTEVSPPVVTTREQPAAETTRRTPERRPRTASPQVRDAGEIVAVVRARVAQAREEAREASHGRLRAHRHGPHHR